MSKSKKPAIMTGGVLILLIVGSVFVAAFVLWLSYNNSIPEITKDMEGKQRIRKISYWNAFALLFLLSFITSTTYCIR